MRTNWRRLSIAAALLLAVLAAPLLSLRAQSVHRNGFESLKTAWVKSGADTAFKEIAHAMSDQGAHDGHRSEFISIEADQGTSEQPHVFYQYSTGRAPLGDELIATVWVKANRPGVQVLARVVLPNERNPQNLDDRLTMYVKGDQYRNVGRWQRLEVGRLVNEFKKQQQPMQAQLGRAVNFADAYVDALVLNVYAGPGPTEVHIDDLEVGPVIAEPVPAAVKNLEPPNPAAGPPATRNQVVEFNGTQLLVGGKRFFFRMIRQTDVPLRPLRDAGFNAVVLDQGSPPTMLQEAAELGLWVVPSLRVLADEPRANLTEEIGRSVNRFADNDAVLFWMLGGTLDSRQGAQVNRLASMVRTADPGRPVAGDVWDGLKPYSRNLNLVGAHRWPLMTTLELPRYREWLDQRRHLANPGSFLWTWVQTHLPDWYTHLLYEQSPTAGFAEPIGPQPEQIRLLTYVSLGAGCKGVGYWSDRFLADSHQGRDRLLCLALLNQELEMLEPLLTAVDDPPQWIDTSVPEVKAAILRTQRGILVLPMWIGKGCQFVPGQSAASKLSLTIPQVPQSTQAWEVTPGEVRSLRPERVVGGTKITIPEFGLTTAVVFTSDTNLIIRFQEQARTHRQLAAQWTYDQAVYEMEKVLKVEDQLEKQGHTQPDGPQLVQDARSRLQAAKNYWDSRQFSEAYREAQRALRPLRILMRAQWETATKGLDSPVASPYAVSFYTLPRHWQFMNEVKSSVRAANVLPGGDFEMIPERTQESWRAEEMSLDDMELLATRVREIVQPVAPDAKGVPSRIEPPKEGKQCLLLEVKPKNRALAPNVLEGTMIAITSPGVRLPAGSLVQVSGWVRLPANITGSTDGALLYDSAGGEPLGIRLTEATPWKRFVLYRRVPASGTIYVTLALTGIGSAYFDDIRIEPLQSSPERVTTAAPPR